MPIDVHLPTALRPFAERQESIALEGQNIRELLEGLTARHAELRKHIFSDEGKLRNFVNVYVNDEDIRHLKGVETPVKQGDQVMIVPSIAGGSCGPAEENICAEGQIKNSNGAGHANGDGTLSVEEIKRYSRHLLLPEVGMEGQKKLKAARVLCVGAGGLGSPVTLYLAAAGVGTIGIVDFDVVDLSNLQRQVLYSTDQVGGPKLQMAKLRLEGLNPNVHIETHEERLTSANALRLFEKYDIVLDGTDNFPTRYLVNDACAIAKKPNVYASIFRFDGQVSVFWAERGPCYRCVYPEPPPPGLIPSCAEGGVLGVLPGTIGTLQALEAIKIILGIGQPLIGKLLLFDALNMEWKKLPVRKDPHCKLCGADATIKTLQDYEMLCGAATIAGPMRYESTFQITVEELKSQFDRQENVFLLDVREPHEYEICRIDSAKLIPLGALRDRAAELDRKRKIIVYCKMGGRSAKAVNLLWQLGFKNVINLKGGIDAWAERIDPTVPRY